MNAHETIESIVAQALRELCMTCAHASSCVYHQSANPAVIQCELFQLDAEEAIHRTPRGLCANCDHAERCNLPGRKIGVWHCDEFR